MPGDPIVIDCGGSCRLKLIEPNGKGDMATLLDVDDLTGPGVHLKPGTTAPPTGAVGSQYLATGPYGQMTVMFQDSAGVPFLISPTLPDMFLITSNDNQKVQGDIAASGNVILTVYSVVSDPLVEGKQERGDVSPRHPRRRFVVTNAGSIRKIENTTAGVKTTIFDASNVALTANAVGPALPGGPPTPATGDPIYVSVWLSA